jgi:hypothetical protein
MQTTRDESDCGRRANIDESLRRWVQLCSLRRVPALSPWSIRLRRLAANKAIMRKGKGGKPVAFDHVLWLSETDGGLLHHARVLASIPDDAAVFMPRPA